MYKLRLTSSIEPILRLLSAVVAATVSCCLSKTPRACVPNSGLDSSTIDSSHLLDIRAILAKQLALDPSSMGMASVAIGEGCWDARSLGPSS